MLIQGDFHIIEPTAATVNIFDEYSPGGHSYPKKDLANHLIPLGYDTDHSTYVTVKYSRLLNTGDTAGKDKVLNFGEVTEWSIAWKDGSLVLDEHDEDLVEFPMQLDNVYVAEEEEEGGMDALELSHAIILSILWVLVVDFAIFVKYLYSFKYRMIVHGVLMFLTMVGTIVLVALIINEVKPKYSEQDNSRFKAHYVIGLMVLAWVILQCLVGILQRVLLCFIINPFIIYALRKFHLYSGIILILLGKANVIIGWAI